MSFVVIVIVGCGGDDGKDGVVVLCWGRGVFFSDGGRRLNNGLGM